MWRPQLTASLFLTAVAVATIEQAVSCCTTLENSVRSRFMNSKASDDCEERGKKIQIPFYHYYHLCSFIQVCVYKAYKHQMKYSIIQFPTNTLLKDMFNKVWFTSGVCITVLNNLDDVDKWTSNLIYQKHLDDIKVQISELWLPWFKQTARETCLCGFAY